MLRVVGEVARLVLVVDVLQPLEVLVEDGLFRQHRLDDVRRGQLVHVEIEKLRAKRAAGGRGRRGQRRW